MSPRRVVRAAAVDANARPLNSYPLAHPTAGMRPHHGGHEARRRARHRGRRVDELHPQHIIPSVFYALVAAAVAEAAKSAAIADGVWRHG